MIYKATLIIPIYNEISSLNILCNKIKDTFQDILMKFIFIDDGSKDGSANWLSINLKNCKSQITKKNEKLL